YGADGVLVGISVLKNNETVGLGQRASEESFTSQFSNKDVDRFTVTKRGASSDAEIEAISGATITSNAVVLAVNAGMYFADYIIANS
ncbi:MAG: FMN-binding protein, partial [Lachnospiraceae bacterium]|nr:FMN-binding protein [Lachnospiraceae bacterium]